MSGRYHKTLQALLERKTLVTGSFKLDRPRHITQLLNNPFNNYKCIHVAGTNGKGSVCSKVSAILDACGYRTGLSVSPHISCIRERIQINNKIISENDFCDGIDEITQYETPHTQLSFFELMTVLSFHYFAKKQVDYAVIEVGLGGRLDATNIITNPCLSVITSISLDHTAILGETIELITKEKAGIIKPNSPVVIGPTVDKNIINEHVMDTCLVHDIGRNVDMNFDEENTCIARKCMEVLSTQDSELNDALSTIDMDKILSVKPECRFEIIKHGLVDCVMDCAHNMCAMEKLFGLLMSQYDPMQYDYRVVIGMSNGKDIVSCLKIVNSYAKYIHFVSVSEVNKRSLTVQDMTQCYVDGIGDDDSKIVASPEHVDCQGIMKYALDECNRNNVNKQNKEQVIIVCGSLYIMSEAKQVFVGSGTLDQVDFSEVEFGQRKI
eukprot:1064339_1